MRPPVTRWLRPPLLILVAVGILEGLSYPAMHLLAADSRFDFRPIPQRLSELQAQVSGVIDSQGRSLVKLDADLGWVYAANYRSEMYSTNSRGLRGRREYAPRSAPGILRVAAFGDSFVFCNEVHDQEAWPAQLEALDPGVEVLNYGVGGFGTDQALLMMRRRVDELDPDLVILGFPEVDYARNVNRFRGFAARDDLPIVKPRFVLDDAGGLRLLPPALVGDRLAALASAPERILEVAAHDWFFPWAEWSTPLYGESGLVRFVSTVVPRIWRARLSPQRLHRNGHMNTRSEAYQILVKLIREFSSEVVRSGRTFLLVIFPADITQISTGRPPSYSPLIRELSDLPVLDLGPALRADSQLDPAHLLMPRQHYSPATNSVAARAILGHVRTWRQPEPGGANTSR